VYISVGIHLRSQGQDEGNMLQDVRPPQRSPSPAPNTRHTGRYASQKGCTTPRAAYGSMRHEERNIYGCATQQQPPPNLSSRMEQSANVMTITNASGYLDPSLSDSGCLYRLTDNTKDRRLKNDCQSRENGRRHIHQSSSSDSKAACQVERFSRQSKGRSNHLTGRILRALITRRTVLDVKGLDSLLYAADKIFFFGTLAGRVQWKWSEEFDDHRFHTEVLGTTIFRPTADLQSGQKILTIILSEPLLMHGFYDRDLLLSAFIHELIHCYLFIKCGLNHANMRDGHTPGFEKIAGIIEKWIGNTRLRLCNMRARLEDFKADGNTCCESGSATPEPYRQGVISQYHPLKY
jgi:hypothetical protein